MFEFLFYFVVTVFVGVITSLIIYARWNYGTIEKMGIPVVKPTFILGSYPKLHKLVVHEQDVKNSKQYGSIWGVYEGRVPHIFITDPDLIRQVLIKDFDHFQDKRPLDFGDPITNEMMDVLPYDKWKVVRNFFSPTLTTGKIRNMSYTMLESIHELFDHIKNNSTSPSQEFNVKQLYSCLTTDVIARCVLGTKVSAIKDPTNVFVVNMNKLFDTEEPNFMLSVVHSFPFAAKAAPFFPEETMKFFSRVVVDVMKKRRQDGVRANDFVDLMNDMTDNLSTPTCQKLNITANTVVAQAGIFLLAGFDTTGTTLTMLSYRLACNPEIQNKLLEEVDAYFKRNNGKATHETLGELVYMNMCIYETLRICPPFFRAERVCQKDWSFNGLHIKKGQVIQIPSFAVHHNPEYFPKPDEFQPDRFLPENKDKLNQYAFMAFGQGPHNCIGMRFALEEIKLTMATILKDFYFETNANTKISFKTGRTFFVQYEPVYLNINKRKH